MQVELEKHQLDELMEWWPQRLGDHAESVIDMLRDSVFVGSRLGDLSKKVSATAHGTGEKAISLDEKANTRVRELRIEYGERITKEYQLELVTIGEEENQAFGSRAQIDRFNSSHLVVVADPLDGSTNCRTFGCGYSTVLVSFLPQAEGGYELIGGAIADSNGYTVVWDGLGNVLVRHNKMAIGKYRKLKRTRQKATEAVAAVATKPERLRQTLKRMEEIQPGISESALLMTMAGTPSAFALCALGLGMVVEPKAQKCWDAAHLYPALMLGLEARTLPEDASAAGVPITIEQVTKYFGEYMDRFRVEPELVVPPFYIKN